MQNIKLDIKNLVNKNLQKTRKEKLIESFNDVNQLNEVDDFLNYFLHTTSKLLNEGYSEKEIEEYLFEDDGIFDRFTKGVQSKLGGETDWGGMLKDSLASTAKEYVVKWMLDYLGLKGDYATMFAQFVGSLELKTLLLPFKGKEFCDENMPTLTAAFFEVIFRNIGGKIMGTDKNNYDWSGAPSVIAGNIFGDFIKKQDINKQFGRYLCELIHK